ncbi:MAG: translation initiation factor IF-2 subunit beta [Candidatus Methanoliparum thermophilum]|uniref:Translation initiation factor 2 subunit beta n=1 Tax=Methanoliparum thermophilum TaxID=2491083 RepID=A0A520KRH1_METT2|nr:translation initiation factor IF-2 subunit beta [Candidatus Methanoliparum sp. LAM-1]RZN64268.1 MAG: translation initiation factor IF-2 subunit beta [Candidatus Methanoliparum thermophilum]
MEDYDKLLDKAFKKIPVQAIRSDRFVLPQARVFTSGKTTIIDNMKEIADTLNRDKAHIIKYLSKELGTAGKEEENRAIFQGRFSQNQINELIKYYSNEYVICLECGRPDTRLIRVGRVMTLRCDACGGHRPIKKVRAKKTSMDGGSS